MSETDLPRRTFLRAATVATALSYSRVMGANDKIRLGVIGIGDRGSSDMGNFLRNPDVQVVALCDLEEVDYAEAAFVLGCPVGTVRSRLHRARALLLEKLHQDRHPRLDALDPARSLI